MRLPWPPNHPLLTSILSHQPHQPSQLRHQDHHPPSRQSTPCPTRVQHPRLILHLDPPSSALVPLLVKKEVFMLRISSRRRKTKRTKTLPQNPEEVGSEKLRLLKKVEQ